MYLGRLSGGGSWVQLFKIRQEVDRIKVWMDRIFFIILKEFGDQKISPQILLLYLSEKSFSAENQKKL